MEKNKYLKIWVFSVMFLLGLCFIGVGTDKGTSAATNNTPKWELACPSGYKLDINTCHKDDKTITLKSVCDAQGENRECLGAIVGENDTSCTACRHTISAHYKIEVLLMDGGKEYTTLSCETNDLEDSGCPIGLPDMSRTGQKFLGWSNKSDCSSTPYLKNNTSIDRNSSNGTLYACWESSSSTEKNCYVTEEGKYVSLTPEEAEHVTEEGGTYTLEHSGECDGTEGGSSNKSCFKCSTGGVDPVYQENPPTTSTCVGTWQQTSKADCNTTYYAYFKETPTASSTPKSCSISPDSTSTTCDVNVPSNPTDSNGKTFKGWSLDADTCSNLKTGSKINISKSTTFYACWETKVTVTLEPTSEGTISGMSKGAKKELTCTYNGKGKCKVSESPTATKENYEFDGWNINGACTKDIKNTEFNENTTLTACFNKKAEANKNVTVTYDANGGRIISGNSTEQCTIKSGQTSCTIRNFPTAEKDGYTFGGWGYNENCQSGHQVGTTATTTKTQTLFACWNEINNNENEPPIDEPSNDNNNDNTNNNVEENPKTGQIAIFIVRIVAFCAIGYSIYYYKEIKEN